MTRSSVRSPTRAQIGATLDTLTVNFPDRNTALIKEVKLDGTIFKKDDSDVSARLAYLRAAHRVKPWLD